MFAGGQFGSWLLSRLPELVLRWVFVVFLIFVTANQVIFTPSRDQRIFMSVVTGIGLVLLGVVIGTLAGLLGIGGGALAVPALSILFGASDLIARGTSLLAMFPNSITTSVANMKRKLVHIKAGLIIGVIAALTMGRRGGLAACRSHHVRGLPVRVIGPQLLRGRQSHSCGSWFPRIVSVNAGQKTCAKIDWRGRASVCETTVSTVKA